MSDTDVIVKEWCEQHTKILVPDYCEKCSRVTGIKSKSEIYGVLEDEYIDYGGMDKWLSR